MFATSKIDLYKTSKKKKKKEWTFNGTFRALSITRIYFTMSCADRYDPDFVSQKTR